MKDFGIIRNAYDPTLLYGWKKIYQKGQAHKMDNGDYCWGIDIKSLAHAWYQKTIMPIINKNLGAEQKMIYSAYKDVTSAFGLHKDIKPIPEEIKGVHSLSVLFPMTVEGSTNLLDKVSTLFFDDDKKLIRSIVWEPGSVIWWDKDVYHAGSDFTKQGIKSKQFFITHTCV